MCKSEKDRGKLFMRVLPEELQEVRSKLKRGASEAPGEALRLCACALQRILTNSEMDIYFDVSKSQRLVESCLELYPPTSMDVDYHWKLKEVSSLSCTFCTP